MAREHTEVLVIGAGPTGLFLAAELARHGVRPRVIDRCPGPHRQTRATGVQPGALEVLHRAGLAERFLADSVPVKGMRILDPDLAECFVARPGTMVTPFPDTCSLPQWRTEEILVDHLAGLDLAVERGVTAERITLGEAGALVAGFDAAGRPFEIEADYLVGAGGAHGPVRGALQQHLEGMTYYRRYLVADVALTEVFRDDHLLPVAISPEGMLMFVELPGGRALLVTDLADDAAEAANLEDVRVALARHLRRVPAIADLRWISTYRAHRRMSPKFADGRCFLAGDAAHLCSPLGGEGMNSGFLDGASLAWMLAAVLRRGGRPTLLDAYEVERQQIARQVLASSEATHDFYYALSRRLRAGDVLSAPPSDPTRDAPSPAMLDLRLSESPLLGFHGFFRGDAAIKPGHRFPERSRLRGETHHLLVYGGDATPEWFTERWRNVLAVVEGPAVCPAAAAGVSDRGVVLVRPDGYIGFQAEAWNAASREALDQLLDAQFRPA